jgi:hypothetical protein
MIKIIKFKKRKVLLGIVFFAIYFAIVLYFIINPEGMMEHIHSKNKKIVQIPFLIVSVFPFLMLYSFLRILFRKKAIIITKEYLIDNSKYESIGKIKWKDISKIKRVKKNNIQIFLNPIRIKTNPLKTFIRFIGPNCEFRKSILISDTLLDCSIEELYKTISKTYKEYKK